MDSALARRRPVGARGSLPADGAALTGAEAAIRTAAAAGVRLCLANPGTTELAWVAALDAVQGVRPVLGLFEGVVTGAADAYARLAGVPALALLHLGAGLANGLANLHNARRARSPVVCLVGDHARWHLGTESPLESDVEALARPLSKWVRSARSSASLAQDLADAIDAALAPPCGVATLIAPADCAWEQGGSEALPRPVPGPTPVDSGRVAAVAQALRSREPAILLLGANATSERGLRAAARAAAGCGASLAVETFPARVERGAGLPAPEKLPYFPEQLAARLAGVRHLVLAGAPEPVSFFAYPGGTSRPVPAGCALHALASPAEDAAAALEALADVLGAPPPAAAPPSPLPGRPSGALTPQALAALLARLQPEAAVIVDEGATSSLPWWEVSGGAPRHSYVSLTGGAIGMGPPAATGAALACPGRTVIDLQADGSGMYTLQALWTQAREALEVKTIVCANRAYRILRIELARAGIREPGPAARRLTELSEPNLDWVALARGMGVPAERAADCHALADAIQRALATPGPYLVEALL
jgi:acetolactate synthase-1/2/3 large subunit